MGCPTPGRQLTPASSLSLGLRPLRFWRRASIPQQPLTSGVIADGTLWTLRDRLGNFAGSTSHETSKCGGTVRRESTNSPAFWQASSKRHRRSERYAVRSFRHPKILLRAEGLDSPFFYRALRCAIWTTLSSSQRARESFGAGGGELGGGHLLTLLGELTPPFFTFEPLIVARRIVPLETPSSSRQQTTGSKSSYRGIWRRC